MGMNIKDPAVHAMARELAARRGTTVTDAVRQALRAELEKTVCQSDARAQAAREERLLALLDRFRGLPWPQGRSGEELEAALYDEHGLPR